LTIRCGFFYPELLAIIYLSKNRTQWSLATVWKVKIDKIMHRIIMIYIRRSPSRIHLTLSFIVSKKRVRNPSECLCTCITYLFIINDFYCFITKWNFIFFSRLLLIIIWQKNIFSIHFVVLEWRIKVSYLIIKERWYRIRNIRIDHIPVNYPNQSS
jgi:hypothetical protein